MFLFFYRHIIGNKYLIDEKAELLRKVNTGVTINPPQKTLRKEEKNYHIYYNKYQYCSLCCPTTSRYDAVDIDIEASECVSLLINTFVLSNIKSFLAIVCLYCD